MSAGSSPGAGTWAGPPTGAGIGSWDPAHGRAPRPAGPGPMRVPLASLAFLTFMDVVARRLPAALRC